MITDNNKIALITGANSGIGKEATLQLAREGFHVVMVCRNEKRAQTAIKDIKNSYPEASLDLFIADMAELNAIRTMVNKFKTAYDHLDVLINNAALFDITQKQRNLTSEGLETIWATNHLGPVLLTTLLLESLMQSKEGRILNIASKGLLAKPFLKVDLKDPEFENRAFNVVNAYYQSKIAQIMYTYWLSKQLSTTNISVNCFRVPAVKVDIDRYPDLSSFMKWVYKQKAKAAASPTSIANNYVYWASHQWDNKPNGKYFDEKNNYVKGNKYIEKEENIQDVMGLTKSYIPEWKDF
ncbi:SDR family NAD(P)-dependent oxidoreductase [Spirochaeta cellobiosiphila]|uniref:SDR family NAD(P)-dependent oxidoreductase n=1 Tax=Spirochaeta cellobiosiphila TaxID=504483 RepID=UPI0003FBD854|nr:SDR family NAD(P)-dependent oxidoreductase [Spirochaeta cellobiosiphila]